MFQAFHEFLVKQQLLVPGDRVLVALSGGPDSVALLHLLQASAARLGAELRAAHLDHGLRPESIEDARFVADLCLLRSIPLDSERCNVAAVARRNRQGLEEAGRDQRREFLMRVAGREVCSVIALGHHRGDQVETFLHRLLRGTGLSGLAAMRPRSGPFIRPLLPFSRGEILDFLMHQKLDFREDASNRDRCFTRNRIRLDLLPLLQEFNPRVEERLAGLSRRIALEEEFWQEEVEKALQGIRIDDKFHSLQDGPSQEGAEIRLDRSGLLELHPALRARVLRHTLGIVRGELAGLSAVHLESLEELVRSGPSQGELHLPGAWVARRYEIIRLRCTPPSVFHQEELTIEGPGDWLLTDGRRLRVRMLKAPLGESALAVEFAAEMVSFPLSVRSLRPGDRFRPDNGEGSTKIKKFFIDQKVDRESRTTIPLVIEREILWIGGLRRCAGREVSANSEAVLRIEILPQEQAD
ncbi:MAG: tRNA lysidine(34) synthetase TilS [Syntrophotaleaceae bacterium]